MRQQSKHNLIAVVLLGTFVIMTYTFWSQDKMSKYIPKAIRFSHRKLIPIKKSIDPNTTYPKWIVVTSINHPTKQIKKLSQIPGWTLLVVADLKTPKNWTFPNSVILTTDAQLDLGYQITKILPWNAYTRKMIGYLYAIQHGAEFIYDTDDDNAPNDSETFEKSFTFEPTMRGLVLNDREKVTANPYIHFGQSSVWPRGFPLEDIGQDYNNSYTVCQMETPLIQQGLVNGDPDVDAIFRLTRKKIRSPLNIQFDGSAPPLVLPQSVLTPFNSQNTIFHYDAFWSMMLPVSVTFRVTDIWRGYWAQPLLWAIGGHLGFFSAHTTQFRNAHVYLKDFGEEDKLYQQAGNLARVLREWKCSGSENLYDCMAQLTQAMVDGNFWQSPEIELTRAWIEDLKTIGYKMPGMRTRKHIPCLDGNSEGFAIFTGITQKSESEQRQANLRTPLRQFCNFSIPTQAQLFNPVEFPSTLLVVTFNHSHYENIWLLDQIYRPHFPNMIYCGDFDSYNLKSTDNEYSFVGANTTNGFFAYECAQRVIDMNYGGTTGYLIVSDEIVLNFWNNAKLNPEEVWLWKDNMNPNKTEVGINLKIASAALAEIVASDNKIIKEFEAKTKEYGLNEMKNALVDIYYFPASKQNTFYEVGNILKRHGVISEAAVPIIMSGLSSPKNTVGLNGFAGEGFLLDVWTPLINFVHPLKFSNVLANATLQNQYCDLYINNVLSSGTLKDIQI